MQNNLSHKRSGLFFYLLLLTACFIVFEISLTVKYSDIFFSDFKSIADRLSIPWRVAPGIIFYVVIQLLLHVLFTVLVWLYARLIGVALKLSWKNTEKAGFFIWSTSIITVLLTNQYLLPNSKFAVLTEVFLNQSLLTFLLSLFVGFFLLVNVVALFGALSYFSKPKKIAIGLIFFILIVAANWHSKASTPSDGATEKKPNIILIGIDSLRPDFLGFFGYEKITPHLDEFLNNSTAFSNSLTPLARTFPSWTSILTGEYPLHHGGRTNLINPEQLKLTGSLAKILKTEGYRTVFATDETRFSNISRQFGFDSVVSAPLGFNDFLLGTVNDFPLSNIIVNTFLGKFLFPYSYANRPAIVTYDPNSFLNLLKPVLSQSRSQPLFLAVHFCLPHFPYSWGTEMSFDDKPYNPIPNYQASIKRVDTQFYDFLMLLKQNNLLNKSIVVLLSDHGETIEMPGDRITSKDLFKPGKHQALPHFYPKNVINEALDKSAGHGTDVLGLPQYHNVLAFRFYGFNTHPAIIPGWVSTLDIKPTLLDLIGKSDPESDGRSLKNSLLGKKLSLSKQDFFTESDFSPPAIHSVHPETKKLLFEGIDFFEINPISTHLSVRKSMQSLIYSSKQYADFYGSWVLALYPQSNKKRIPILVNLETGEWTDDLESPLAKTAPAKHMLHALVNFYGIKA